MYMGLLIKHHLSILEKHAFCSFIMSYWLSARYIAFKSIYLTDETLLALGMHPEPVYMNC
jgi:hypothetical protein